MYELLSDESGLALTGVREAVATPLLSILCGEVGIGSLEQPMDFYSKRRKNIIKAIRRVLEKASFFFLPHTDVSINRSLLSPVSGFQ